MDTTESLPVALITGASHGIGRAVATRLGTSGFRVGLIARSVADLEQLAFELNSTRPDSATPLPCDVGNRDEVDHAVGEFIAREQRLDAVVLCAGTLGELTRIDRTDPARWHETLRTNLDGSYYVARSCIRALVQSNLAPMENRARHRSPRVLFVSSSVGRAPRTPWGAYAVSKAAVEALALLVALEAPETGVLAASINPGGTATRMRAEAYPDENPAALPGVEQIAGAFARILDLPDDEFNGQAFNARDWTEESPVADTQT